MGRCIVKKAEISQETRFELAQSLKKWMARKAFDKITVREILEDCNVSRATFYYHFEDIYALMQWMFQNELIALLAKSENCVTWEEGVLMVMRYVAENDKVCLCAYNSIGRDELRRYFASGVQSIMRKFVDSLTEHIAAKPEDVTFIVDFYTGAFVTVLVQWLLGGVEQTPEQMLERLNVAVHGSIQAALERSAAR